MSDKENPRREKKVQSSVLFGFAYRQRRPNGKWTIRFRWGRIAVFFGGMAVLGYVAFATALYFFFKNVREFDEVRYADMFTVIFRMDEHRARMGDSQIEKAKKLFEEGDYRGGLHHLRTGVARSPKNLEGRRMLAEFYLLAYRRPDMAIQIMDMGLPYAYRDPEYLKSYLQILLAYQKDGEVVDVAKTILKTDPPPEIKKIMALGAATALHYRGNFDEAEDYLKEYQLENDLEGTLLTAKIFWERGQREQAIERLESALGRFPNDEPLFAALTRFYRETGDLDRARQYAVLRTINAPLSVAPRIDLLHILQQSGMTERANREADSILRQFQSEDRSLLGLANFAAESGNVALANRIYETALQQNMNIGNFALLLIETYIAAGDYERAIQFTEELANERPAWLDGSMPIFNTLRSVAYFGNGQRDLSRIYLNQFLKDGNLRAESLIAVSRRFRELGGYEEARQILQQAVKRNPENQVALTQLIALEIAMGNSTQLEGYLKRLIGMRRPSQDLLRNAYQQLGSDRFIFTPDRETLLAELNALLNTSKGS